MKSRHPNRIPFEGVLTRLDQPSDKAPEDALDSLIGMAVGFADTMDGHNARQKCGIIDDAFIVGDELRVKGYLFGHDFPEVAKAMGDKDAKLGMSYEMIDAHVTDMRAEVWTLDHVTITGAAILLADKAAYRSTTVCLSASGEENGKLCFEGQGIIELVTED